MKRKSLYPASAAIACLALAACCGAGGGTALAAGSDRQWPSIYPTEIEVVHQEFPLDFAPEVADHLDETLATLAAPLGLELVPDVIDAEPLEEVEASELAGDEATLEFVVLDAEERSATPALVSDETFQTVGLTWEPGAEAEVKFQVRTRDLDGSWGPWFELKEHGAPDPGSADYEFARPGTEAIFVGDSDAVQIATYGPAGELVEVEGLVLSVIGSTPEPEFMGVTELASATAAPAIVTRAQWNARPQTCAFNPAPSQLRGAVVHHTVNALPADAAAARQQMRNIQSFHQTGRGWCDIGYNFIVDPWGNIMEGRANSLNVNVVGVHAGGFNTGTVGIAALGDFTSQAMSTSTVHAIGRLIAWRFGQHNVDPLGSSQWTVAAGSGTRFAVGARVTLPNIMGHRDVSFTACPGNIGHTQMTAIRQAAAGLYGASATVFINNSLRGGVADSAFQWGLSTDEFLVGDWFGDGARVALRRGNEFHFRRTLTGGGADLIITFGQPGDDILVGDWFGLGRDTLALRRGNTFQFSDNLQTGRIRETHTFGRVGDEVFAGDWNGNGRDTLGVRRGNQIFLMNTLRSGVADQTFTFGRLGDELLVGNWTGTGGDTFAVRRGITIFVMNTLRGGHADQSFDFGRLGDRVLVGNWDNRGGSTFGVVR